MLKNSWKVPSLLCVLIVAVMAVVPAFAGSAVVGSVAGSMNATVEGQPLLPNSVVFSGQSLSVKDGAAVVATSTGARMVFGRDTSVSFLRDQNEVTLQLGHGNVSLYQPDGSTRVRVQAGSVSVVPASGFKTLCQVAMIGNAIVVTAERGSVRVEGNGAPVEVSQGKTLTIEPRSSRAPQAAGGSQHFAGDGSKALEVGAIGAGGVAAILAGIGISRSNDAKNAALAAESAALAADSDAKAATGAANAADSDAKAATSAAIAAGSAAAADANAVGCALNNFATGFYGTPTSPYTPPDGETCSGT